MFSFRFALISIQFKISGQVGDFDPILDEDNRITNYVLRFRCDIEGGLRVIHTTANPILKEWQHYVVGLDFETISIFQDGSLVHQEDKQGKLYRGQAGVPFTIGNSV